MSEKLTNDRARQLPSLNALRAFEASVRLGGVTSAARELHVTHGAVSRHIRALQADLGQRLFERQGRGLIPTPAGQRLREACSNAFAQLAQTWSGLREDADQAPFVLGCPGSLLARWLIPRLERLAGDLPELRLHLSAQEEPLSAQLNGADAALLLAAPPWPAPWRVHKLAPERIGPVFSPRSAAATRLLGRNAAALAGEPLLFTVSRPQAWSDWARASDVPLAGLRQAQGFPHLYHLLEAAVAGLGVAIAPAPLVAEDVASGRLLAPWGFCATGGYWILAAPQRAQDGRYVDALAKWLRTELADG